MRTRTIPIIPIHTIILRIPTTTLTDTPTAVTGGDSREDGRMEGCA